MQRINQFLRVKVDDTHFVARYLFGLLYLVYLLVWGEVAAGLLPWSAVLVAVAAYLLINSLLWWLSRTRPQGLTIQRIALWADLVLLTGFVVHDPIPAMPTILVVTIVMLGNGLRYGTRLYREALLGAVLATLAIVALRHYYITIGITVSAVVLILFSAVQWCYGLMLTQRLERYQSHIESLSLHDALTGLKNRRGLEADGEMHLSQMRRHHKPLALLILDLDNFKAVNDQYGHARGDDLLQEVGEILKKEMRPIDVAARMGGDEFVVLLPETTADQACSVAERIQRMLADLAADYPNTGFGVSIGVSRTHEDREHGNELEAMVKRADQALYRAKSQPGKNAVVCAWEQPTIPDAATA